MILKATKISKESLKIFQLLKCTSHYLTLCFKSKPQRNTFYVYCDASTSCVHIVLPNFISSSSRGSHHNCILINCISNTFILLQFQIRWSETDLLNWLKAACTYFGNTFPWLKRYFHTLDTSEKLHVASRSPCYMSFDFQSLYKCCIPFNFSKMSSLSRQI